MKNLSRSIFVSLVAAAALGLTVLPARAQDTDAGGDAKSSSEKSADSGGGSGIGGVFSFPEGYRKRLLGNLAIGEARDQGITNGRFAEGEAPTLSYTNVSASLGYDHATRSGDYLFDYRGDARHYNRYSFLDVLSHDAGVRMTQRFLAHTVWNLTYRFSSTPDLAGSLMAETLTSQMSFINPLPVMGIRGIPVFGDPFQAPLTPADGLITLRSLQIKNAASTGLTHEFSYRAKAVGVVGFDRTRFQDKSLFPFNKYYVGAAWWYMLSPRTSVSLGYEGERVELVTVFNQSTSHGASIGLMSQLGRKTLFTARIMPSQLVNEGQQVVALPTSIANLLGQTALIRNAQRTSYQWFGIASLSTRFHESALDISYQRLLTDTRGLGGAAVAQSVSLTLSKSIRRRTTISGQITYGDYNLVGLATPLTLVQEGFYANLNRQLAAGLDMSAFFNYSKILNGAGGPKVLGHNIAGVTFTYHFPRVSAMERP